MGVIYIVLPLALLIAGVALLVFVRATRSGQFDDLDTPGLRMLNDDDPARRRKPGSGETDVDPATGEETGAARPGRGETES